MSVMIFSEPTRITAQYRIVTPMFLGGESHLADAKQFRNASLKGALRFWWRALNWSAVLEHSGNQVEQALKNLHDKEGALFGIASDGENSRQSLVFLDTELEDAKIVAPGKTFNEISYLLGLGLHHFREGVLREYINGGNLRLTMQFKSAASKEDIESVRVAAVALGIFGGLGSRARKGLGSLSIQKIEEKGQPAQQFVSQESVKNFIASLNFSAPDNAPLTALSQASRIDISATETSALKALTTVCNEQQLYRGYGQNGKVNGMEARKKFKDDHDFALNAIQSGSLPSLPRRAVFGLPHNYFFSSIKSSIEMTTEGKDKGRRASPLFIHIHALENDQFIAIQTLLPGVFLPPGVGIEIKPKGKSAQNMRNYSVDYGVIHSYLDGFQKRQTLRAANRG